MRNSFDPSRRTHNPIYHQSMELNREHFSRGTPAGKRKHSGSPAFKDRPSKHMRETDSFSDDDSDLEVDMISPDASALTLPLGIEPERLLPATALADSAEWQRTIESVVRNVVSIRFCQTCSFDTDSACTSEATGFVVDAEKGYIMTNRHVVSSGPFWGYCVFDNHEEVLVLVLCLLRRWLCCCCCCCPWRKKRH